MTFGSDLGAEPGWTKRDAGAQVDRARRRKAGPHPRKTRPDARGAIIGSCRPTAGSAQDARGESMEVEIPATEPPSLRLAVVLAFGIRGYELFPGADGGGIRQEFPTGVTIIAGVNGLGETTFQIGRAWCRERV